METKEETQSLLNERFLSQADIVKYKESENGDVRDNDMIVFYTAEVASTRATRD